MTMTTTTTTRRTSSSSSAVVLMTSNNPLIKLNPIKMTNMTIMEKKIMRVGVVGWRKYTDYEAFSKKLNQILMRENITVKNLVSGHCKGTDMLAEKYAKKEKIEIQIFHPVINDKIKSPECFFIRNRQIVENSDIIIAFVNEKCRGTVNTIGIAKNLKKRYIVVKI